MRAVSHEGKWTNVRGAGFFGFRHEYRKNTVRFEHLMRYFSLILKISHQQGGNQSTQPTRPTKIMAWLLFGGGLCDLEGFLSYCTFKDVYIILGANIGYNSIWKLSAQITIESANDDRECK